jgi:hypothetical protein
VYLVFFMALLLAQIILTSNTQVGPEFWGSGQQPKEHSYLVNYQHSLRRVLFVLAGGTKKIPGFYATGYGARGGLAL